MAEGTDEAGNFKADRDLRKKLRIFLVLLLVAALVLAAWGVTARLHQRSQLRKRTSADAEITVVIAKPALSGAGEELVLPGFVQAFIEAPIYARTSGYLKAWHTDIGSHVHTGELLAEIETPEIDRQLSQSKADLATARANLTLSRSTNERWKELLNTQSVSKQDADEKAGDAAAKEAIADSAAQNVRRLQELQSFKRVVAPFNGVVTARNTDVGDLINAGQASGTELFRIADTHKLRIYAQVPEAYATATTTGLQAELHFAERPGRMYPAETIRTSNALDPSARTLQVELQLDNDKGELFPGAYAEVHFKLPESVQTMRLPANVILFREGLQVATVDQQHKIKLKSVTQGRDFGKTVEILTGIERDDAVVVNPPDSIEDGVPVRIAPPPPPAQDTGKAPAQKQS